MSRWLNLSLFTLCAIMVLPACGDDDVSPVDATGTTGSSSASGSGSGGDASTSSASTSGGGGGGGGGAANDGGGGSGGGEAARAVAQLEATASSELTGTATFTQVGDEVTLVLSVTGCPEGDHSAHIHENKSCANNANDAGDHWVPNGEGLGSFTCDARGTGTHTVTRGTDVWTVGDDGPNDVTQFAIVVHAAADPSAGGRIGCGVIDLQ
ncbi:superoxide dismutase family protein [Sorangium sp. So ce131]|uniref:superoxide dismutase family protein n=1 Tax=Sorangium sp. So ce131 TaxID=3133282 RepID=UPI003F630A91